MATSGGWSSAKKPPTTNRASFSFGTKRERPTSEIIEQPKLPSPGTSAPSADFPLPQSIRPTLAENVEDITLDVSPTRIQSLRLPQRHNQAEKRITTPPDTGKLQEITVDPEFSHQKVSYVRKSPSMLSNSAEIEQDNSDSESDSETNRSFGSLAPSSFKRETPMQIGMRNTDYNDEENGTEILHDHITPLSRYSESEVQGSPIISPVQSVREFRAENQLLPSTPKSSATLQKEEAKKYEKLFLKYFKLTNDHFVDHTLCSYQQAMSIRGRLYISNNHLCFHSKFYRRVIPLETVKRIEKQNSGILFSNAIALVCHDDKRHLFCTLPDRDKIFSILQTFLPNSIVASPQHGRRRSADLTKSKETAQKRRTSVRTRSLSDKLDAITEKGNYVVQKAKQLTDAVTGTPVREEPEPEDIKFEAVIYPHTPIDDEAHSNFHLPSEERVFEACYCSMKRAGTYQAGRLYLTQHYICFRTIVVNGQAPQFFQLSLELIDKAEKVNIAQIFPTAVKLTTKPPACENYFFAYLTDQERLYQSIRDAKVGFNEVDDSIAFIEGRGRDLYRKHFVRANLVSPNEPLLATARCTYCDPVTRRGHLYITENFICYHVINYKSQCKQIIPFISVYDIKQKNNSLIIFTSSARYVLETIENIDQILVTLNEQRALRNELVKNIDVTSLTNIIKKKKQQMRFTVGSYQYSASAFFMKSSLENENTLDFVDVAQNRLPDGSHTMLFQIYHPWPLSCAVVPTEDYILQLRAEKVVRELMESPDNIECRRIKKGNLFEWNCYLASAQSGSEIAFAIFARRKMLPPAGNTYQDIILQFKQHFISSSYPQQSAEALESSVLEIWESFTPKVNYDYERATILFNIESLSCDYTALSWVFGNLKLQTEELTNWSYEFLQSILYQMEISDINVPPEVRKQIPPSTQTHSNPCHVIAHVQYYSERQCDDDKDWYARVSFFFSWVIEYMFPGFSWRNVIQLVRDDSCPPAVRDALMNTIHLLLHMRRGSEEFLSTTIELKVGDPEFMKSFSYNERFAYILLENNFFRYFLEDKDLEDFYGKFLVGFLRNTDSEEMCYLLCKEIAWYSLQKNGCSLLLAEGIVVVLFQLLNCFNELVIRESLAALVNLLANNTDAKKQLVRCGIIRLLISRFLATPSYYSNNTLGVALKLLRTCSDTYARQIEITKENGLELLATFVTKPLFIRDDELFINIMATLWRVINDANRPLLCQGNSVDIICSRLQESSHSELLRVGLGCLVNLCCQNEYNCVKLAELGFVSWISEVISTTENAEIIRNCLLLLLCQCQYDDSRMILLKENLLSSIICWAKFGAEHLAQIANQIYAVLLEVKIAQ